MRSLTKTYRMIIGAVALLAAVSPASARAADADLAVTIDSLTSSPDPNPDTISYGQTKTYAVLITNNGPAVAEGVVVTAVGVPTGMKALAIAGCIPQGTASATNPLALPCLVVLKPYPLGELPPGGGDSFTAEVDIDVTLPIPDAGLPTTCPTGSGLDPFTVTVGNAQIPGGPAPTTDPTPGNDTGSFTNTIGPFADLALTMTAPSTADIGGSFDVPVTIVNNGPCPAINVEVLDFDGLTSLTLSESDPTGDCTHFDGDNFSVPTCAFGTMASGEQHTLTRHFVVGDLPSGLLQTGDPVSLDVFSGGRPYLSTSAHNKTARTYDPDESNNAAATQTVVKKDQPNCSTGGMGGALSLLLLAVPFLRRRRRG